jgi:hypothetical protein
MVIMDISLESGILNMDDFHDVFLDIDDEEQKIFREIIDIQELTDVTPFALYEHQGYRRIEFFGNTSINPSFSDRFINSFRKLSIPYLHTFENYDFTHSLLYVSFDYDSIHRVGLTIFGAQTGGHGYILPNLVLDENYLFH